MSGPNCSMYFFQWAKLKKVEKKKVIFAVFQWLRVRPDLFFWTCEKVSLLFCVSSFLFFSRDGVEMLPGLITPTPERTNRRLTDVMVHSRKREHPRSKPEFR